MSVPTTKAILPARRRGRRHTRPPSRLRLLVLCLWILGAGAPIALASPLRPVRHHPRPGGQPATAAAYVTSRDMTERLAPQPAIRFTATLPAGAIHLVRVNDQARFQHFNGVGGAMTDSSAWLLETQLGPSQRAWWLSALFGALGARLGFLRVPMAASDFTAARTPYSYDDQPSGHSDPGLADFSVGHDAAYVIPALRQVLHLNPSIFVLANPWSPPSWMKANDTYHNLNHQGAMLPSYFPSLADYFVKFIEAYQAQGITINAVTPLNEPGAPANYPSADLQAPGEADFVAGYLTPALRSAGLSAVKVYGYDGSWGVYPWNLLSTSAADDFAGIAWHCYLNNPSIMTTFHYWRPRVDQIGDECSTPVKASTAQLTIASLRDWASSVVLWNLALDQDGGPVQQPNIACDGCTGIITVDTTTHTATPTLDFFQLAQLSRFVQPGAVRIGSNAFSSQEVNSSPTRRGINDVAFLNPDGQTVLVAYNNSSSGQRFAVSDRRQYFSYTLAPGAMVTFTWKLPRTHPER